MTDSASFADTNVKAFKLKALSDYKNNILLKITAKNGKYLYFFSLNDGLTYEKLSETSDNILLAMMYTGANIGVYATSNGKKSSGYADFD